MADTKEYIILIASRLFLQKSFKEVTMSEIVKKTGLSKGAFYHYFESKEQLFVEVLSFYYELVQHDYSKYSQNSFYEFYHDYAEAVAKLSDRYMSKFEDIMDEETININYIGLMFDALKMFPEFRANAISSLDKELGYWQNMVAKARATGEIKSKLTDSEIAKTFYYLADGVGMHETMRGTKLKGMMEPALELWDKLYELIKA